MAVVLVGAVPMAAASTNPNADPIISQAVDGTPNLVDAPAPGFTLTDQRGSPVSLSSLRGKAVALTFLDPVCTSDCPLIAQEFHQADTMLGSQAAHTEFVAVVANPIYHSLTTSRAFDRQEGLDPRAQLALPHGFRTSSAPRGGLTASSCLSRRPARWWPTAMAYVIDPLGQERAVLDDDAGDRRLGLLLVLRQLYSQIDSCSGEAPPALRRRAHLRPGRGGRPRRRRPRRRPGARRRGRARGRLGRTHPERRRCPPGRSQRRARGPPWPWDISTRSIPSGSSLAGPRGRASWWLVTPPGVADNGGLRRLRRAGPRPRRGSSPARTSGTRRSPGAATSAGTGRRGSFPKA